jgi:hypothetical protein
MIKMNVWYAQRDNWSGHVMHVKAADECGLASAMCGMCSDCGCIGARMFHPARLTFLGVIPNNS